ncbi:hypothetical protein NCAS_0G00910 [Naumovozyma castellii]|uniref:Vacuolar protein sorting-associated protein 29 n=1 Tax=Naumovozyma castellii TaxID=27288 RepID=G0VHU4_NAUCA|nr:hypothetical protein NCAS_0G00910 [Naumovozyma castellii CBS 4309]CCC70978.1 hypothetical protein NCAS_0G00910 [Naumovozyma castellii CBS 4309]
MLLLALGDAHIPDRAIVILLGNCTRSLEFLEFVQQISSNITVVRGEFDSSHFPTLPSNHEKKSIREEIPMNTIIRQGDFKIGCCSGYAVVPKNDPLSLLALARQLDVDILLWSGTHNVEAYTLEGKFFVNPGSCTGAFNVDWPIEKDLVSVANDQEVEPNNKQSINDETADVEENNNEQTEMKQDTSASNEEKNSTSDNDSVKDESKEKSNEESPKEEDVNTEPATAKKEVAELKEEDIDISDAELNGSNVPSFCLLDVQGPTCTLYIYIYVDGEVKVDKVVFEKN